MHPEPPLGSRRGSLHAPLLLKTRICQPAKLRLAGLIRLCGRHAPINRQIVLDRFLHQEADLRFGEASQNVVLRPPIPEFPDQIESHFSTIAFDEERHFKDQIPVLP